MGSVGFGVGGVGVAGVVTIYPLTIYPLDHGPGVVLDRLVKQKSVISVRVVW